MRVIGPDRDQTVVGVAALVGAGTQALAGLLTILLAPAALVAAITAVAGVSQVRRDLDAAALRFGVALLASLVVALFSLVWGVRPLIGLAVVSSGAFAFALLRTRRLATEAHDQWGLQHRARARRQAELRRRRDAQVVPPAPPAAGPTRQAPPTSPADALPAPGEPVVEDDTAWWDDLE